MTEPEDGSKGWLSSEVEAGLDLDGLGVLFLTMLTVRQSESVPSKVSSTVVNEAGEARGDVGQRPLPCPRRIDENFRPFGGAAAQPFLFYFILFSACVLKLEKFQFSADAQESQV